MTEQKFKHLAIVHGDGEEMSALSVFGPFDTEEQASDFGIDAARKIEAVIDENSASYSQRYNVTVRVPLDLAPQAQLGLALAEWRDLTGDSYSTGNVTDPEGDLRAQRRREMGYTD